MLKLRTRSRPDRSIARRLYDEAVKRARNPALYSEMGAPDTVEGRFELLTAHIVLVIERLNAVSERGLEIGQDVFDLYVRNLDGALREMGVGDLAVGKRMKSLGQIFYGRAVAYRAALTSLNLAEVEALVARTILAERSGVSPRLLAGYLLGESDRLADLSSANLVGESALGS